MKTESDEEVCDCWEINVVVLLRKKNEMVDGKPNITLMILFRDKIIQPIFTKLRKGTDHDGCKTISLVSCFFVCFWL